MHLGRLAGGDEWVQFDISMEAIASRWIKALAPGSIPKSDH